MKKEVPITSTLMTTPLPTPGYIVDQMFPKGLHIPAGCHCLQRRTIAKRILPPLFIFRDTEEKQNETRIKDYRNE